MESQQPDPRGAAVRLQTRPSAPPTQFPDDIRNYNLVNDV